MYLNNTDSIQSLHEFFQKIIQLQKAMEEQEKTFLGFYENYEKEIEILTKLLGTPAAGAGVADTTPGGSSVCPSCGKPYQPGEDAFCMNCGPKL